MGSVGFLFDENLPPAIARALAAVNVPCRNIKDQGLESTDDIALFEYCQQEKLVLVTKDRNILKNAAERRALEESRLTIVNVLASRTNLRGLFKLVVKYLEKMEETLADVRPCVYVMSDRSFHPLDERLARRKRH